MKKSILALFSLAVCLAQQAMPGVRAIEGTLKGSDGTLIANGSVLLRRLPPFPARVHTTQWHGTSGNDGTFRFDGIAEGQYSLCAQVPASVWLNPCEWGKPPDALSVRAPQQVIKAVLVMVKGAALPIRIDDPRRLLAANEGKTPGAHIFLGVGNDIHTFVPALRSSDDAGGRIYTSIIPFDVPIKLVVNSGAFQLSNSAGQPLPRTGSTQIPVTASSKDGVASVHLIVTGAAAN